MKKNIFANLALLLTAFLWGVSFVAQKAGMDYIGPFTFNAVRSFLGCLSLIPVIWLEKLLNKNSKPEKIKKLQHLKITKAGILCGIALFIAMSIQQYCMLYVDAGKAGFISALYIIYVPIISAFFGKKISNNVIMSVFIAVIGLYLLCFKSNSSFNTYDMILLISTLFYGIHIIVVNNVTRNIDPVRVSLIQFLTVGILSIPLMFGFETPTLQNIYICKIPLLYAGILTCGVAYTLQIFGQKYTTPTIASLLLCLESVFAVLGGTIILNETMTIRETIGCILMISAVILSKLHILENKKENKTSLSS